MRNHLTRNYQSFALGILLVCTAWAPQHVRGQAALEDQEILRDTVDHQEDALIGKFAEAVENLASSAETAMAREVSRDLHAAKEDSLPESKEIPNDSAPSAPSVSQALPQEEQDPLIQVEEELQELPE